MPDLPDLRYGRLNVPLMQYWMSLAPSEDGPFLAVNLMRYKPLAQYADGRETTLTGREADDLYTPFGPLAGVGAKLVFAADVEAQPHGEPHFHRVAIVRYPTRMSFIEMERREDFRELHVHKEAGMDFTVILAVAPPQRPPGADREGRLVLRLGNATPTGSTGTTPLLSARPEGVMIGDEREWEQLDIECRGSDDEVGEAPDQVVLVLQTLYDDLAATAG